MNRTVTILFALSVGVAIGVTGGSRLVNLSAEAQTAATTSFSAVPDAIGEQDISGPYQVQAGWPKDLSTLDLWRRARHLRRKPEPRVPARRRRAAENGAAVEQAPHRRWSERAVPHCRLAVAERQ